MNLSQHSHTTVVRPRKSPKTRTIPEPSETSGSKEDMVEYESKISMGTQVTDGSEDLIEWLKETVMNLEAKPATLKFCIENISSDDQEVTFYTGFPNYICLKACYDYLGPLVDDLKYWGSKDKEQNSVRFQ